MTDILMRSRGINVKATDDNNGYFEAVVSAFGNIDSYGDVMVKGAFARTLAEWKDNGGEIPFLWSHASHDPMAYVAGITEAEETDEGLVVRGKFDLDTDQSKQAYKLLKSRRVKEFSFGFIVKAYEFGELDGTEVRYVKDVDLLEVSMTILGANPSTRLVAIKTAQQTSESNTIDADALKALVKQAIAEERAENQAQNKPADTAAASDENDSNEAVIDGKSDDGFDAAAAIDRLGDTVSNYMEGRV